MYRIILILWFFAVLLQAENIYYKFYENKGLLPDNVLFWSKADNLDIFVTNEGLCFHNYYKYFKNDTAFRKKESFIIKFDNSDFTRQMNNHFDNNTNFFKGSNQKKNKSFDSLYFKEFQPGKDLVLKYNGSKFRFDVIINENAEDKKIDFELLAYNPVNIFDDGATFSTSFDKINISDINIYQEGVNLDYIISKNENIISIAPLDYNPDKKLIIDPLIYSTYFGGNSYDIGKEIEIDSKGNIIIAGNTSSIDFPVTEDAYSELFFDNDLNYPDVFVTKFDSAGNLLFSTYIGSYGDDYAEGLRVSDEAVYLTGYTFSYSTFPVSDSAMHRDMIGGYDIFVLKLSVSGDSLIYSTLFGGERDDIPQDIEIFNNRIAITGYTGKDGEYPVTNNAFRLVNSGKYDSFLTIFDDNLENVIYSTLFGGSEDDFSQSLRYSNNMIYITGMTNSSDISLVNPGDYYKFNLDSTSSESDAFLARFNTSSSQFEFLGLIGGSGNDKAYGIGLDSKDNVFIAGYTESNDFPVTSDAFDIKYNELTPLTANGDVFIAKFNNDNLLSATYLGHDGTERALALDIFNDNVFVTGSTTSLRFPTTFNCFDSLFNSVDFEPDGFISRFDNDLSNLMYSTYFGGDSNDIGYDIKIRNNIAYVTGRTHSGNFPFTYDAFDSTRNDSSFSDVFLIGIDTEVLNANIPDSIVVCSGSGYLLDMNITGSKGGLSVNIEPDTLLSLSENEIIYFYNDITIEYLITITDLSGQIFSKMLKSKAEVSPHPEIIGKRNIRPDTVYTYTVYDYNPMNDYYWSILNGEIIGEQTGESVDVIWHDTLVRELKVYETSQNNCPGYDSAFAVDYIMHRTTISIIEGDTVLCYGDYAILDAGAGFVHYYWNDRNRSRFDTVYNEGYYYAIFEDSEGYGGLTDTVYIRFLPSPEPVIHGDTIVQIYDSYRFSVMDNALYNYLWDVEGGEILFPDTNYYADVRFDRIGYQRLFTEVGNEIDCRGYDTLEILAGNFLNPVIQFYGNSDICDGDSVVADAGYGYIDYLWNTGDTSRVLVIRNEGEYWCVVTDIIGNKLYSDTIQINTYPSPGKPGLAYIDDYLRCYTAAYAYQWYLDGELIEDSTRRYLYPQETGHYSVRVINQYGCGRFSESVFVNINSVIEAEQALVPYLENHQIYIPFNAGNYFMIFDYLGRKLEAGTIKNTDTIVDVHNYTGVIMLIIIKEQSVISKKFLIIR